MQAIVSGYQWVLSGVSGGPNSESASWYIPYVYAVFAILTINPAEAEWYGLLGTSSKSHALAKSAKVAEVYWVHFQYTGHQGLHAWQTLAWAWLWQYWHPVPEAEILSTNHIFQFMSAKRSDTRSTVVCQQWAAIWVAYQPTMVGSVGMLTMQWWDVLHLCLILTSISYSWHTVVFLHNHGGLYVGIRVCHHILMVVSTGLHHAGWCHLQPSVPQHWSGTSKDCKTYPKSVLAIHQWSSWLVQTVLGQQL